MLHSGRQPRGATTANRVSITNLRFHPQPARRWFGWNVCLRRSERKGDFRFLKFDASRRAVAPWPIVETGPAGQRAKDQTITRANCLRSDPMFKMAQLASALERVDGRGERQDEGERRIEQGESAIAFVPARRSFVLGVDQQSDAADIIGDAHAAVGRTQQESAAEPLALRRSI